MPYRHDRLLPISLALFLYSGLYSPIGFPETIVVSEINHTLFFFHLLTTLHVTLYCLANSVGRIPFLLKALVQSCFPVPPPRIVAKNDDPIRVFLFHPSLPTTLLPFPISLSASMPFHPSTLQSNPLCKYSDRLPPETCSYTLRA